MNTEMKTVSVNRKAKKNMASGSMTPFKKDRTGKAKMRRTMSNRGEGTHHVPGPLRIPKTRNGYFPLHGEGGY